MEYSENCGRLRLYSAELEGYHSGVKTDNAHCDLVSRETNLKTLKNIRSGVRFMQEDAVSSFSKLSPSKQLERLECRVNQVRKCLQEADFTFEKMNKHYDQIVNRIKGIYTPYLNSLNSAQKVQYSSIFINRRG